MSQHSDILLIGLRGSGKTTLGRALAARFNRAFVDLDDHALAAFAEPTIADVWRAHGEQRWREAENAALHRLMGQPPTAAATARVIALGGGTPMIPQARSLLEHSKRVNPGFMIVYLRCSPATLRSRLLAAARETGKSRPALLGVSPIEEIDAVMAQRDATYRRLADLVIEADHPRPEQTLDALVSSISERQRFGRADAGD